MNDAPYRGADCDEPQQPPEMFPPISSPYPNGTDAYAGDASGYGADPYATNPTAYGEDPYAEDLESQHLCSSYYESEPVQFSYTPADVPQRAAVVRPDRETLVSLILPAQVRMPLYHLAAVSRPPTDVTNPPLASGSHMFE